MKQHSSTGAPALASGLVSKQPEKSWSQGAFKKRPSQSRIPSSLIPKPIGNIGRLRSAVASRKLSLSQISSSASGASVESHPGETGAHRNSRGDTAEAGIIQGTKNIPGDKHNEATEFKSRGEFSPIEQVHSQSETSSELDLALNLTTERELEPKVPRLNSSKLVNEDDALNDPVSEQNSPKVEGLELGYLEHEDRANGSDTEADESPARSSEVAEQQDKRILAELQEADQQASQTVKTVEELKRRICDIQNKEHISDSDNDELQAINEQLKKELKKLEIITRNVQRLVGIADMVSFRESYTYEIEVIPKKKNIKEISTKTAHMTPRSSAHSNKEMSNKRQKSAIQVPSRKSLAGKSSQDEQSHKRNESLSKLSNTKKTALDLRANKEIYVEDLLPRVIICGSTASKEEHEEVSKVPAFSRQLRESYSMQERLAADNVDLESEKYRLQEELLKKDQFCDSLQRKLTAMENEMRLVTKENNELSEKLLLNDRAMRSADRENQEGVDNDEDDICMEASIVPVLKQCRAEASALEDRLAGTTNEMSCLRAEFEQVRKERCQLDSLIRATSLADPNNQSDKCVPGGDTQIIELTQLRARHAALQQEFESRSLEVEHLTRNCEQLSAALRKERSGYVRDMEALKGMEEKLLKDADGHANAGQRADMLEHQYEEASEELEELRSLNKDLATQLENYRGKYLTAQQSLEEERRQVDLLQQDNVRANEQVNLEVQRVKETFQERLRKLSPLPYLLEESKLKLQEALSQKQVAERTAEKIAAEFRAFQERARAMADEARRAHSSNQQLSAQQMSEQAAAEALRTQNISLTEEVTALRAAAERTATNEQRLDEHLQESRQLVQRMEQVHQTATHQMVRYRERSDTAKRAALARIAELEASLAQARAAASCAAKEHEELRRGLQDKVDALRYDYEDAILRINGMQGHVQYLQDLSGNDGLLVPVSKSPLPAAHLAEHFVSSAGNDLMAVMAATNPDGDCVLKP